METTRRKPSASKVLIIGADGADPAILEQLMAAGQLPHLSRLREEGLYGPLSTTYPAVSPVAWTSLLTGCWPAKHGVIDFVTKAAGSYHPTLGLYQVCMDSAGRLQYRSRRTMPTIAERLSRAGLTSYLLHVPGTFPAFPIRGGLLAGLGTPDLVGTFGASALYTMDPGALPFDVRGRPEVEQLLAAGEDTWVSTLVGPDEARLPLFVRWREEDVFLQLGEEHAGIRLLPDSWSDWIEVSFPARVTGASQAVGPARGICRFYVFRGDAAITLYRTPIHHSPAAPGIPLCWPADFAPRLAAQLGPFPTASFPMEQSAYQHGLLPASAFRTSAYEAWEQQVRLAETVMAQGDWNLCMLHLFTVDSLQHLFWPDVEGEIAVGYRWLDEVIGRLRELAGPETVLIVVSDHGVAPLEQWVHLNLWLKEHGFLVEDERGHIDWKKTRAFCLGYGGIYLNVMGREPYGIVEPGWPYEQLRTELAERLKAWRDPLSGRPVVEQVLPREAWHSGPHVAEMPDLIVTLQRGYGLARQDARGQLPDGDQVLEPNRSRWRAGHEGPYAPEAVPGIFLMAGAGIRPGPLAGARIVDVAPTVLWLLGLEVPADMDGRSLW